MATHCNILACEVHGQRSLVGYSLWDCKELDMAERTCVHTHTHIHTHTPYSIPQGPYGWPFMLFPVIDYYKNNTEVDILASKSLGNHALVYKGDSPQMELLV